MQSAAFLPLLSLTTQRHEKRTTAAGAHANSKPKKSREQDAVSVNLTFGIRVTPSAENNNRKQHLLSADTYCTFLPLRSPPCGDTFWWRDANLALHALPTRNSSQRRTSSHLLLGNFVQSDNAVLSCQALIQLTRSLCFKSLQRPKCPARIPPLPTRRDGGMRGMHILSAAPCRNPRATSYRPRDLASLALLSPTRPTTSPCSKGRHVRRSSVFHTKRSNYSRKGSWIQWRWTSWTRSKGATWHCSSTCTRGVKKSQYGRLFLTLGQLILMSTQA
jgi:hypothetical protein